MMLPTPLRRPPRATFLDFRLRQIVLTRQFSAAAKNAPDPRRNGIALAIRCSARPSTVCSPELRPILLHGMGTRFASSTATSSKAPSAPGPSNSNLLDLPEVESTFENTIDNTELLSNIPESIGYLKNMGLNYGIGPTQGLEWLLEHIHIWTGTPWWASIVLTCIVVRATLLRTYVAAADTGAKLQTIKPVMDPIREKLKLASRAGDSTGLQMAQLELMTIYKRAGVSLWKGFLPVALQIPVAYGLWKLLNGMAALPVPGLVNGGVLWFPNLTVCDPFFIMPLAMAGVMHLVVRKGGETGTFQSQQGLYKIALWGFPALSILATWWVPAAVQLSFLTTSIMSALQALAFRNERVRKYLNIALLPKVEPKEGFDPSGSRILRLRNDQYSVEGQNGAAGSGQKRYKSFFLNRERVAPKGMDVEKYERAKAAFAGGQWLQAKQYYQEAVKDLKYNSLPSTSISSVSGKSGVRPRRALWRTRVERYISDTTKPMTSYMSDRKDDTAAKQRRAAIDKFERERREEESLKRQAEKHMRKR